MSLHVSHQRTSGEPVTKRYLVAPLALVALAFGAQALAHHSFAAIYVEGQSVTIEGQLV